ncbi:MAG TPA: glycine oxidase ThiO [Pyrinomonadaceae bacterium]|nr:glycine oxidase ThiO [Pyrinomonadaceae bacterium]
MDSDVLIIGGGVIGLSIARELRLRGVRQITVVDRGYIGGEASWAAAGMLAPNAECDRLDDFHRFCTESLGLYPDFAASLLEETGVDIELDRAGTLYAAFTNEDVAEIRERFRWQSNAGLNVRHLSAIATREAEPSISNDVRESLFFPDDWQVENRKVIEALRTYCLQNGIQIIEQTEVREIFAENGKIVGAATANGRLFADHIVLAGGAWTSLLKIAGSSPPFTVKPIRGQMLCYRTGERPFRRVIYSPRGYLVPRADGRILAGSTVEDVGYDKGVSEIGIRAIESAASEIAPGLGAVQPAEKWAGLRPFVPPDGLPVIGGLPGCENLLIATGHFRNGILLTPLTARIAAEKILNEGDSEYLRIYNPARFSTAASSGV